ncbi:MAG: AraC family transcriptional regulator [Trueperaceae bacterium]|nr:AraC family transcriptional regulator [Trueperaceae bacterium]
MADQPEETYYQAYFQILTGYFKQSKGYRTWRSKGTSDWLFIYTLAGKGRFGYQQGEFLAQAGDAVMLKPYTLHDYGVEPGLEYWEFLWAHFQPRHHWLSYLQLPELTPGLLHLRISPEHTRVAQRFSDVHSLATGGQARREDFAMNALEEVLLWLDHLNPKVGRQLDPRISKIETFLRQHLDRPVKLKDLAELCDLSSSRLSHLFKEQVGMSPLEFLDKERMERAMRLLELSSTSIQDIAAELGFDNPFYFSRRFKAYTNASPKAYRMTAQSRKTD